MPRRPFTEEEKRRISDATRAAMAQPEIRERFLATRADPDLRRKLSEGKQGTRNPMYGKSPSMETRSKMSQAMKRLGRKGSGNPAWKGAEASLSAVHIYVSRRMPLTGVCSRCGQQKWTERAFLHWPAAYTRNPDDYAEMCRRCHMQFDRESGQRP